MIALVESRRWLSAQSCSTKTGSREVTYPVNTVGAGLQLEYSLSDFLYQLKLQLQI
jgi:hypothetical protein